LIALASSGADGADLPPANINGQINMSGTSGKVALVNSFDGLVGNCPTTDPHVMDFVGYGAADCREGTATAPSPSTTTSIFRLGGGATDTDRDRLFAEFRGLVNRVPETGGIDLQIGRDLCHSTFRNPVGEYPCLHGRTL
jgi:hypothetical protein